MAIEETKVDDLVVLGRAYPEPIKDGRETVCLGGFSDKIGYVRLYPTQRRMTQCRRWNVISVPAANDPDDPREESYKIQGSKEDWDFLHRKIEKVDRLNKPEQIRLIDRLAGDCRARLNEEKLSLGIVDPSRIINYELKERDDTSVQLDLNFNERKGKNDFPYQLYLKYRCKGCEQKTPHEQHCIEYGIHKYWEKNDDPHGVFDALNLGNDQYKHYFFIGNLRHRRTAYVVISVLRFKKSDMLAAGVNPGDQAELVEFS